MNKTVLLCLTSLCVSLSLMAKNFPENLDCDLTSPGENGEVINNNLKSIVSKENGQVNLKWTSDHADQPVYLVADSITKNQIFDVVYEGEFKIDKTDDDLTGAYMLLNSRFYIIYDPINKDMIFAFRPKGLEDVKPHEIARGNCK